MKIQLFILGLIIGAIIGFGITKIIGLGASVKTVQRMDTVKWQWPDSLDAVRAAPNSHKVLFENDNIRILEVTLDPYAFEPMHTHNFPSVMFGSGYDTAQFDVVYYPYGYDSVKHVYFAKDSIQQHSGGYTNEPNTGNYMKPEGPHRVKNLSNVRVDVFRVEFKTGSAK